MINENLLKLLNLKGVLSLETVKTTFAVFSELKSVLKELESNLKAENKVDSRIKIQFTDRSSYEAELKIADEVLIFIMHTNSFVFDTSHPVMKSSYVLNNNDHATCGMISVYNFQSDSFKYDRKNDIGLLIARMFVNKDSHFFVEGRKQLGFLFNDYLSMKSDAEVLSQFIQSCIMYCLEIDVIVPPMDAMKAISVIEATNYNLETTLTADRHLGFKFQNEINAQKE